MFYQFLLIKTNLPGGPYNKIPDQGFLTPTNKFGNLIGNITASYNAFFALYNPEISSHYT